MSACDVCSATTSWQEGTAYTAAEFKKLVSKGFEPGESSIAMGTMFGSSRKEVIAAWREGIVAQSTTDWLLCPACAARANPLFPKKAGTGPSAAKQTESIAVAIPRTSSQSPAVRLTGKKWWQFWK